MSKKNNLGRRKRQHEFDLQSRHFYPRKLQLFRPILVRIASNLFQFILIHFFFWAWVDCAGENAAKEKAAKKLQANKTKMKIDIGDKKKKKKKKKGCGGFQVGKRKVKTKLSALAKAKLAQAMEVDK